MSAIFVVVTVPDTGVDGLMVTVINADATAVPEVVRVAGVPVVDFVSL